MFGAALLRGALLMSFMFLFSGLRIIASMRRLSCRVAWRWGSLLPGDLQEVSVDACLRPIVRDAGLKPDAPRRLLQLRRYNEVERERKRGSEHDQAPAGSAWIVARPEHDKHAHSENPQHQ